jgi:hypothetical protein
MINRRLDLTQGLGGTLVYRLARKLNLIKSLVGGLVAEGLVSRGLVVVGLLFARGLVGRSFVVNKGKSYYRSNYRSNLGCPQLYNIASLLY